MEVRNPVDVEDYLARSGSWLRQYGFTKLPDPALVEDTIQELAIWALAGVARGRSFNSHYLGQRFRSLLRDARRDWLRSCPSIEHETACSMEEKLTAQQTLARLASVPDGALVADAVELGYHEAAALHGLSEGALHVRVHRFRQRHAELAPGAAA